MVFYENIDETLHHDTQAVLNVHGTVGAVPVSTEFRKYTVMKRIVQE
jgi:hypothetical protein